MRFNTFDEKRRQRVINARVLGMKTQQIGNRRKCEQNAQNEPHHETSFSATLAVTLQRLRVFLTLPIISLRRSGSEVAWRNGIRLRRCAEDKGALMGTMGSSPSFM